MGDFLVLGVLLQGLVRLIRERLPHLDGLAVNGVAVVLGCGLAFVAPDARVASDLTGLALTWWVDMLASGVMMAVGAKVLTDALKAMAARSVEETKPTL